jgi:hypothetical protein
LFSRTFPPLTLSMTTLILYYLVFITYLFFEWYSYNILMSRVFYNSLISDLKIVYTVEQRTHDLTSQIPKFCYYIIDIIGFSSRKIIGVVSSSRTMFLTKCLSISRKKLKMIYFILYTWLKNNTCGCKRNDVKDTWRNNYYYFFLFTN